jgi:hypothetical protein
MKSNFDWASCVAALTEKDRVRISNQRWYSRELVEQLYNNKLIGAYNGGVAFPVQDNGKVVGTHYCVSDSWRYAPSGDRGPAACHWRIGYR